MKHDIYKAINVESNEKVTLVVCEENNTMIALCGVNPSKFENKVNISEVYNTKPINLAKFDKVKHYSSYNA